MSSFNFQFIEKSAGISSFVHERNGLRVLLLQDSAAPVATAMVTYHVGSRNGAE